MAGDTDIPHLRWCQCGYIFMLSLSIQILLHFSSLLPHTHSPSVPIELPTHTCTRSCGGCRLVAIVTRPKGCRLPSTLDSPHRIFVSQYGCGSRVNKRGPHTFITMHIATSSVDKIQNVYLCDYRVCWITKLDITVFFSATGIFSPFMILHSLSARTY